MKVLFDHQVFLLQRFGGISRYHYKLFENLRALAPESTFEIAHKGTNNFYIDGNKKNFAFKGRAKLWNLINRQAVLKQLPAYDVLHPTYYDPYFLQTKRAPKYVLTVHDMIPERELQAGRKEFKGLVQNKKRLIEKAPALIAISEATKKDILRFINVEPSKISVIHHGGPDAFDSGLSYRTVETVSRPYFLYVGERGGYKKFQLAVEAFGPLLRAEDLHLVAAGGKLPSREELVAIERSQLTGRIHFKQNVAEADLFTLYKNAICFIYPSLIEGFGIPLLEAFSAACPVLCSRIECFKEIAGEAALFFEPDSAEDLRAAARKVYESKEQRAYLKEKGARQLAKFSWQKTARATFEVYRQL